MGLGHFICRDEEEREWQMDMHARLGPLTRRATVVMTVMALACLPWFTTWSMVPIVLSSVCFGVGAAFTDRRQRITPLVAAWFTSQALLAVAIVINGREHVGDLAFLILALVGASGGFPTRLVVVATGYTVALMTFIALAFDGQVVLHDPPRLVVPVGLAVSVTLLATAVRQASIEHRAAAVVDSLTSMLNRTALTARAAELEYQAQWNGQPVSAVLIDLDRFKTVNDTHGHAQGDAVLCDFAYRIRKHLRSFDAAYRLGGEEFLILAPGLDGPEATALAERLCEATRAEPIAGLAITASFGVACSVPGEGFSLERVMAAADTRLYAAKAAGRDRVVGPPEALTRDGKRDPRRAPLVA